MGLQPDGFFRHLFAVDHAFQRFRQQSSDLTGFPGDVGGGNRCVFGQQRRVGVAENRQIVRNLDLQRFQHPVDDVQVGPVFYEESRGEGQASEKLLELPLNPVIGFHLRLVKVRRPVTAGEGETALRRQLFEGDAGILGNPLQFSRPLSGSGNRQFGKSQRLKIVDHHPGKFAGIGMNSPDVASGGQLPRYDRGCGEVADSLQLLPRKVVGDHTVAVPVPIDGAVGVFDQPVVFPADPADRFEHFRLAVDQGAENVFAHDRNCS